MAKEIKLTRDKIALVDDEDYERVSQYKWWCSDNGYAARKAPRNRNQPNYRKNILMHRFIMNTPEGFQCDHIDGNTLNNQKSNLRNVTCQQNGCNKSKCKNLFSKYKGVSRVKRDKKWQAYITVHQKPIFLGCFTNELDAAVAYNNAAIKYFGEYAKLNQIEIAVN